ncbi:HAMP domain-containing sensor histidine kinase [Qipengyuania sp. XHP0207]|uniref:sensor histidine kinase n=1 Tax=Qipengyuania sp. XHP0207 TaxID=3038078 RepID=UPI00241E961C|nr:HAMP domain-containing sensor histidine kinase [Qipengyuania sp. XHP0207]MDG5747506.1 HAMP domain-containing sensor histidine kinase [Qipengyuania sp. XHP0207]
MGNVGTQYIAHGKVDADGSLVAAEEPLASLQEACGGEVGGAVAIPELRSLVHKAADYGLRLARQFSAVDGENTVTAWVEIAPHFSDDGRVAECDIDVVSWHAEPLPLENDREAVSRRIEINRHLADCLVRLNPSQGILSVETQAPDLADFLSRTASAMGAPWTDFVELPGNAHEQPLHWRLLDGARCAIDGSDRMWTAHLEPLGKGDAGSSGFVLYLTADRPLDTRAGADNTTPLDGASFGRDLTPVLRQPINRIIANAETIRTKLAGPIADEYSSYAADIAIAAQHLLALIDDLSDLEVVESEQFVTAPDRIELADVARRACGILGVRAQERGISLVPPVEGESQLAIAEFRRVLQILLNLVGNAIRYAPEDSQVWIRLDRIGSRALITVADQGHGLDQEQQAKVFRKFERLGRSGDGGSGLGLYISRRIARAMDGDLTVESAPGQGARFTLSVPAADDMRSEQRDGPGKGISRPKADD